MTTDIVSVVALQLSAHVGPDCWGRPLPQPIQLTVHLHLTPHFLNAAGKMDKVADSIHYGHLAKIVGQRVNASGEHRYPSVSHLIHDVTDAAFTFVIHGSAADIGKGAGSINAVRVIARLPKQLPQTDNFELEATTPVTVWQSQSQSRRSESPSTDPPETQVNMPTPTSPPTPPTPPGFQTPVEIVRVKDLTLPVLIGVNPPERLVKQRVITHLTFHGPNAVKSDYPTLITRVTTCVESTAFLTLEKLVMEIISTACRASPLFDSITVCCQKPSALSFADASAVEMTRKREDVE